MSPLEAKLVKARSEYANKLLRQLEELADLVRISMGEPASESIEQAQRLAHKIHGSAGTFGFKEVSEAVGAIDRQLVSLLSKQIPTSTDFWQNIEAILNRVKKLDL